MVDFARMNFLKAVIETDFDTHAWESMPSQAKLLTGWAPVMEAILRLPIAAYVEPQPVSGEIDDERRPANGNVKGKTEMSWNNGNRSNTDAVYNGLDNAKELGGARFPFFEAGNHKVAVVLLEEYTSKDGQAVRLIGEILESNVHKVGDLHTKIWKIEQPPKFPNGVTPADEFAAFCRALKGAPKGVSIGANIRVLMKDRAAEQLARGTVIKVTGVANAKKTWTNLYWEHIPQGPEQIAQQRARIEQSGLASVAAAGSRQDQGQTQPQGGYGVQVAQQMMQQQPQQQGYAMPQQTWGAPTQQMQAPVQYQQPMQPQQPAQPQGGFLSQIPPTNNGGNQGGGSW
jgi:hypothetical protein